MLQFVQILILGLSLGGVYALMASGLTLIFGVMRIVNLAHAAFIIVAAYLTYFLFQTFQVDPILSMVVTIPAMFLFGVLIYRTLFSRLAESSRFVDSTVLLTFALGLITEGSLTYFFTGIYRSNSPEYSRSALNFGPLYFPEGQFYATLTSIGLLIALWGILRYTRVGYAIRATMQNRMAARTVGVDVDRISWITFGLGAALAGASGALVSFLFTFFPAKHWEWISLLMALIVLGGMGSLLGALVGALLLGVASAFVSFYFGPIWSPITFYLALFIILMVRPQGLFGKKVEGT
jgi:branched-chain amino acid transport system permease protein